ncbi:MAG: hypothetical protein KBT44_04785 [Bacteroidales bacterium]|nr:hypothetical protein [Candidatus Equibacterium intestinale]
MKKLIFLLAATAVLALSCEEVGNIENPEDVIPDKKGELYTAEQAKTKFQDAAVGAMELVNPDDFKQISELADFIAGELEECDIDDELAERLEDAVSELGYSNHDSDVQFKGDDEYRTEYYDANWIYSLAPFTGKYSLKNGRWTIEDASNLVIIVPDASGKDCVLTLDKSSKTTTVKLVDNESSNTYSYHNWMGWDPETYQDYYTTVYEDQVIKEKIDLVIPETITVTIVDAGQTVLSAEVKASADINGVIFPGSYPESALLEKAMANISMKVDVAGYTFCSDKIKFEKNEAALHLSIRKGDLNVATVTATTGGFKFTEKTYEEEGFTHTETDVKMNKINVGVDIIGQLQISGSVDMIAVEDCCEKFYEACDEGKPDKECLGFIDEANNYIDLGVYFGTRERQASMLLDGMIGEINEWGYSDSEVIPIIQFADKSKYSFEEYFNDTDFRRVIGVFEDLVDRFERMLP